MACFVVPVGEAVVTSIVQKIVEKREAKAGGEDKGTISRKWSQRLGWLNKMLWGGGILLAFEHLWHGEVVPWPPFLTAMENPADVSPMLHEMATFGVAMAVTVTTVWAIIVLIAEIKAKAAPEVKRIPVSGGE
jgi:hypothetical protein